MGDTEAEELVVEKWKVGEVESLFKLSVVLFQIETMTKEQRNSVRSRRFNLAMPEEFTGYLPKHMMGSSQNFKIIIVTTGSR